MMTITLEVYMYGCREAERFNAPTQAIYTLYTINIGHAWPCCVDTFHLICSLTFRLVYIIHDDD